MINSDKLFMVHDDTEVYDVKQLTPEEKLIKSWTRESGYLEKTILDDPEFLDLVIGLIVKG